MLQPISVQKRVVQVNGTDLYGEMRGRGPAVLFICGATGDAGHFERVAEQLADAFTVITYDRRGNSRSPRPQDGPRPPYRNRRTMLLVSSRPSGWLQ